MYLHETKKRVRYAETDKMGYLYYGHYAKYYEIGRVEALRDLGLSYKEMEDQLGLMLPVLSLDSRYKLPAYYDDEITIKTMLKELPLKMFTFHHSLVNQNNQEINTAVVKLFCVDMKTNQRANPPSILLDKLASFFNN